MPADASKPVVVSVTRDSSFQVSYVMSDGTGSAFPVTQSMGDLIENWWDERDPEEARSLRTLRDLFSYWTATEANKIRELLFAHMDEQAADIERLTKLLERRERQMGLAAKYIDEYYELARDMHDPTALMGVGKIDAARRMVFAIGANLKRILEGAYEESGR